MPRKKVACLLFTLLVMTSAVLAQPARDHTTCTLLAEVGERAFGARETGSSRKDTLSAVRRELANQVVFNSAAQVIVAQEIVAAIYGEYYVKSAEQAHVKVYNACMSEWLQ
jgi:hypothetical protein